MLFTVWIIAQLTLVAVAVIDPRLASTFARTSFLVIGAVGGGFTLFLALRGQDRALSLIPTWILFLIWIFGDRDDAHRPAAGRRRGLGLVAGLVLILVLIGFTVTQFAFRSRRAALRHRAGRAAAARARRRRRRLGGVGMERAPRRDQGQPLIEASLGLEPGRAFHQGRRLHQAPAPGRSRTVPADAVVHAGAHWARDPHRFPHAPRGQYLPLVRARSRQRPQRRTRALSAASALSAT